MITKAKLNGFFIGMKLDCAIFISHLLFNDDVIIFVNNSVEEWKYMYKILEILCSASGMEINPEKK